MKPSLFISFTIVLFTLLNISASGQSNARRHTNNSNAWFMYFGNHKFSSKLGWHTEVQLRRNEFVSNSQQLLLRTGLDYYLKNNARLTFGYAFIETHPYGGFAVANAFPEHRIWQQFTTTQDFNRFKLNHRYRLEQRNIGNAATGEFKGGRFENRVRYMVKGTYVVTPEWKRPLFAAAYDEIFLSFGKEVAYNIFDQNRLYGALGITISETLKMEVGYLYQLVQARTLDAQDAKMRMENNHTLQIGLFSTMSFLKQQSE
jgi:hypothetical protein